MRILLIAWLLISACGPQKTNGIKETSCYLVRNFNHENPGIKCGQIEVPENRKDPNSRQISISYAILKAINSQSKSPVLYLNGGPGGTSLELINFWMKSPLRNDRDLILVDQRGTGYSSPLPDIGSLVYKAIAADLTMDQEQKMILNGSVSHIDSVRNLGISLESYNAFENVDDIIELMEALPYKDYHLLGISYGTKLSQILTSRKPELVKSAVMYGPVSINTDFFSSILDNYQNTFEAL